MFTTSASGRDERSSAFVASSASASAVALAACSSAIHASSSCERAASGAMTNLGELSPPEQCTTSEGRKKSRQECEAAYAVHADGLIYPCVHAGEGACRSSILGAECSVIEA